MIPRKTEQSQNVHVPNDHFKMHTAKLELEEETGNSSAGSLTTLVSTTEKNYTYKSITSVDPNNTLNHNALTLKEYHALSAK